MINKILLSVIFRLSIIKTSSIKEWSKEKTESAKLKTKEVVNEFLEAQEQAGIIDEDKKKKIETEIDVKLKEVAIKPNTTLKKATKDLHYIVATVIDSHDTEEHQLQKHRKELKEGEKLIEKIKKGLKEILNQDNNASVHGSGEAEATSEVLDPEIEAAKERVDYAQAALDEADQDLKEKQQSLEAEKARINENENEIARLGPELVKVDKDSVTVQNTLDDATKSKETAETEARGLKDTEGLNNVLKQYKDGAENFKKNIKKYQLELENLQKKASQISAEFEEKKEELKIASQHPDDSNDFYKFEQTQIDLDQEKTILKDIDQRLNEIESRKESIQKLINEQYQVIEKAETQKTNLETKGKEAFIPVPLLPEKLKEDQESKYEMKFDCLIKDEDEKLADANKILREQTATYIEEAKKKKDEENLKETSEKKITRLQSLIDNADFKSRVNKINEIKSDFEKNQAAWNKKSKEIQAQKEWRSKMNEFAEEYRQLIKGAPAKLKNLQNMEDQEVQEKNFFKSLTILKDDIQYQINEKSNVAYKVDEIQGEIQDAETVLKTAQQEFDKAKEDLKNLEAKKEAEKKAPETNAEKGAPTTNPQPSGSGINTQNNSNTNNKDQVKAKGTGGVDGVKERKNETGKAKVTKVKDEDDDDANDDDADGQVHNQPDENQDGGADKQPSQQQQEDSTTKEYNKGKESSDSNSNDASKNGNSKGWWIGGGIALVLLVLGGVTWFLLADSKEIKK